MDSSLWFAISLVLWTVVGLFTASTLFWLYEMLILARRYVSTDPVWDASAVQVRVVTIGRERVVQATVTSLPATLDDVHVLTEKPMQIDGATVHVVPEDFTCAATGKGRAVEWGRRNVPCDREYVLYLDEDTILPTFDGLPDADVVQLREMPIRTRSRLSYYTEIFRMGFQLEQRAFSALDVPLYAWGGGLAVRRSLEDAVTWDEDTIIEDTTFTWRAVVERGATFALAPTLCFNQAPPTVRSMVAQRRRWIAGSREENDVLPVDFFLLYGLRNLAWGLSPVVPFLGLVPFVARVPILFESAYLIASSALLLVMAMWSVLGVRYYGESLWTGLLVVALTPLLTIVHSSGALLGILSPPDGFQVTEKIHPEEVPGLTVAAESVRIPIEISDFEPALHLGVDGKGNVWIGTDAGPDGRIESGGESESEFEDVKVRRS